MIRWRSFDTEAGTVNVAATSRGVCRLSWGDTRPADFSRDLRARFPDHDLIRDADGELVELEDELRSYLKGESGTLSAELDLDSASDFERRVLEATCSIPYGLTMTYSELARRIGKPGASQAVGNALRRNPVPILAPCHRVVRSDGTLGGYGGPDGTPAKEVLLRLEGVLL